MTKYLYMFTCIGQTSVLAIKISQYNSIYSELAAVFKGLNSHLIQKHQNLQQTSFSIQNSMYLKFIDSGDLYLIMISRQLVCIKYIFGRLVCCICSENRIPDLNTGDCMQEDSFTEGSQRNRLTHSIFLIAHSRLFANHPRKDDALCD